MRVTVEETVRKTADVDVDVLIDHFRSEWEDFLRGDPDIGEPTDEDKREWLDDTIGVMGMADFFLPNESPWISNLEEDTELDVRIEI
jgi:hypothetical protein